MRSIILGAGLEYVFQKAIEIFSGKFGEVLKAGLAAVPGLSIAAEAIPTADNFKAQSFGEY